MGLDISLYDGDKFVDEKSEKHPAHYCNKGYLRSSYNSSGFNNVVGNLIGKEMHYIFDPIEGKEDEEGYYVHPIYPKEQLETALVRAMEVRDELANALPFKTETITAVNPFEEDGFKPIRELNTHEVYAIFKTKWTGQTTIYDEDFLVFNQEALPIYATLEGVDEAGFPALHVVTKAWNEPFVHTFTIAQGNNVTDKKVRRNLSNEGVLSIFADHEKDNPGRNYSCYDGSFYLGNPMQAHGVIAGSNFFSQPAIHIIHQVPQAYLDYYRAQADIIIEFIEKALTLENPRIVWSA